jgi:hypothetical protein
MSEAGHQCRRLAEVSAQPNHLDRIFLACEIVQDLRGAVRTAIVHEQDLERLGESQQRVADLLVERKQVLRLVVDRDHERQHGFHHTLSIGPGGPSV